jgi:thiol-disulfide isomerase/thioredoxin
MKRSIRNALVWGGFAFASLAAGVLISQKDRIFGGNSALIAEDGNTNAAFDAKRERVDGAPASIRELRGTRMTVVNLWATWCTPCREEMPEFIALQKELGADNAVRFIGIAIDRIDPVKRFMSEIGVNYPILLGDLGMIELTKAHGNDKQALPFSYVLDKNGRIIHTKLGKLSKAEILAISAKTH